MPLFQKKNPKKSVELKCVYCRKTFSYDPACPNPKTGHYTVLSIAVIEGDEIKKFREEGKDIGDVLSNRNGVYTKYAACPACKRTFDPTPFVNKK